MIFPPDHRFDNRELHEISDGDDFENFVLHCLSENEPELKLTRRLACGRDGAIDLIHDTGDKTAVVECKFIGRNVSSKAEARWSEVEKNLMNNLPGLATDLASRPNDPYRRWLNPEHPVVEYRYCVSEPLTERRANDLRDTICGFFATLATYSGLGHLDVLGDSTNGAVSIWSWDNFHEIVSRTPPLRFHWFGGLPAGITPLAQQLSTTGGFRSFLRAGTLPYFSRSQFASMHSGIAIATEEAKIDSLNNIQSLNALILTGPGGIGKTRLALELGHQLEDNDWLVVRLGPQVSVASIESLLQTYVSAGRVTFLLDYAEATVNLASLAESLVRCSEEGGHLLRLIATCRASALGTVEDALADLEPVKWELAVGTGNESVFTAWVTQQILEHGDIPDIKMVLQVCNDLPALAAFAVFLHQQQPDSFNIQFRDLLDEKDFTGWARRRAGMLINDEASRDDALRDLSDLTLSLPMAVDARDRLNDSGGRSARLLRRLESDRWVERENDQIVAAHDVLADALTARWLLESTGTATTRLSDALRRAADEERLNTALTAVDRLAAAPGFAAVDGLEVAQRTLKARPAAMVSCTEHLLTGRLLGKSDKIVLIDEWDALRKIAIEQRILDGPLSALAEYAAQTSADDPVRNRVNALMGALDVAVDHPHQSNVVLRRAFALMPDRYRTKVFDRINAEPKQSQTHYLLVALLKAGEKPATVTDHVATWLNVNGAWNWKASFIYSFWLDAGGDIGVVENHIKDWLETHHTALEAQFVYHAWLDAGGGAEVVEPHIKVWLIDHDTTKAARFIYKSWLDAGGGADVVESHIEAWLNGHNTAIEAGFIYPSWLDTGGGAEIVEPHIKAWLNNHDRAKEAQFVYSSWLNEDGDIEIVKNHIKAWLHTHGTALEAQFLYHAWLDAGGGIDVVENHIKDWLETHHNAPDAQFVYKSWLNGGGSIDVVENHIKDWLEIHHNTLEAQFVYKSWLDSGGSTETVASHFSTWLDNHGTDAAADFVFKSWLDAGGSIDVILNPAFAWLHEHRKSEMAVYITKPISMLDDLPDPVLIDIAHWAATFANLPDALFRISRLSRYLRRESVGNIAWQTTLWSSYVVLKTITTNNAIPDDSQARTSIGMLLNNLNYFSLKHRVWGDRISQITAYFVASGVIYTGGSILELNAWDLHAVLNALRAGFLDVKRDVTGIQAFMNWVLAQGNDPEITSVFLRTVTDEFPNPVWVIAT